MRERQSQDLLTKEQVDGLQVLEQVFTNLQILRGDTPIAELQMNVLRMLVEQLQTLLDESEHHDGPNVDEITSHHDTKLGTGSNTVDDPVKAPAEEKPKVGATTINKPNIGDNAVTGAGLVGAGQRSTLKINTLITVTVTDADGNIKDSATSEIPFDNKIKTWSVSLTQALAAGDKVTAVQKTTFVETGATSEDDPVSMTVEQLKSDKYQDSLAMSTGDFWIVDKLASGIPDDDEKAELLERVKDANPGIQNEITGVDLYIENSTNCYITVKFDDGSETDRILAPDLHPQQVTEYSRGFTITSGPITVVSRTITGQLEAPAPYDNIKVQLILKIGYDDRPTYCEKGECKVEKNSSKPIEVPVNADGSFSYTLSDEELKGNLIKDQFIGVIVKEPHKLRSCMSFSVSLAQPEKTEVRDPRKLTEEEKDKIREAIRTANTVGGTSKLPDGTGDIEDPAFIEFDQEGNAHIISPNDVVITEWVDYTTPVYAKNPDGTYKIEPGQEGNIVIMKAEDLVQNLRPRSPIFSVDEATGNVTVTPPAYTNPGDDTDLASFKISYKDQSNTTHSITLTRAVDQEGNSTWSSDEPGPTLDPSTGAVILKPSDVEVGGTITAIAKDNGGLAGDENPLESDPSSQTLTVVKVTYHANGGSGDMKEKSLNKGTKYTILENAFDAPNENQEFDTWQIEEVNTPPQTELTVLKDTKVVAVWRNIQVKVTYDANGGSGSGDSAKKLQTQPSGNLSQPGGQTVTPSAKPDPRVYTLPATGSVDAQLPIWAGLGLVLVSLFLKKRN